MTTLTHRWASIALLSLCLIVGAVREVHADPLDDLESLEGFTGTFEQRILDEQGSALSTSSGTFALKRPNRLRWEIEAPGHQLILVDGTTIWQQDFDLETVQSQPLEGRGATPMELLTLPRTELEARYSVVVEGDRIALTPLGESPLFRSVSIQVADGRPRELVFNDTLDQQVIIRFDGISSAVPDDSNFEFNTPEGD